MNKGLQQHRDGGTPEKRSTPRHRRDAFHSHAHTARHSAHKSACKSAERDTADNYYLEDGMIDLEALLDDSDSDNENEGDERAKKNGADWQKMAGSDDDEDEEGCGEGGKQQGSAGLTGQELEEEWSKDAQSELDEDDALAAALVRASIYECICVYM